MIVLLCFSLVPQPAGLRRWSAAARRLAQLTRLRPPEDECVIDPPCAPSGDIIFLRHGESEWNAANRFTGWVDVPLTQRGEAEALDAAAQLAAAGVCVDVCYTSTLKRTIKTAWLVLEALDSFNTPVERRWRLNERMYGALTGLNKDETRRFLGESGFEELRRVPPPLERGSCYDPARSSAVTASLAVAQAPSGQNRAGGAASREGGEAAAAAEVPRAESFEDTTARVLPCWRDEILPAAQAGKTVLVVSSKNALRSLIAGISGLPLEDAVHLDVPNGAPLIFQPEDRSLTLLGSGEPLASEVVPAPLAVDEGGGGGGTASRRRG